MERRITTKTLAYGQPKPYANHVEVTEVTVERKLDHEEEFSLETSESMLTQEALRVCACIPFGHEKKMYPWRDAKDWYETFIDSVEVTGPGVAVVTIIKPYID